MNLDNSKINQALVAKKIALLLNFVVENLTFQVTINISNDKKKSFHFILFVISGK